MLDEDPFSALMERDRVFERQPNGNPAIHTTLAYHFENEKFVRFLAEYAHAAGVSISDDEMVEAQRGEDGIQALRFASGRVESADLYVDCSGFASALLGGVLGERFVSYDRTLFCDRAVIGGWTRTSEPIQPYTTCGDDGRRLVLADRARALDQSRLRLCVGVHQRRGRAARSSCARTRTSREEPRVVKFRSGRYARIWVDNVVGIGNAGGFVEPLEATALGVIAFARSHARRDSARLRSGGDPLPSCTNITRCTGVWDDIRDFLAVHYRFNTRLDTPFWRHCREHCDLAGAAPALESYHENGPSSYFEQTVFERPDQFGLAGYFCDAHRPKGPSANPVSIVSGQNSAFGKMRAANAPRFQCAAQQSRKPWPPIRSPNGNGRTANVPSGGPRSKPVGRSASGVETTTSGAGESRDTSGSRDHPNRRQGLGNPANLDGIDLGPGVVPGVIGAFERHCGYPACLRESAVKVPVKIFASLLPRAPRAEHRRRESSDRRARCRAILPDRCCRSRRSCEALTYSTRSSLIMYCNRYGWPR